MRVIYLAVETETAEVALEDEGTYSPFMKRLSQPL